MRISDQKMYSVNKHKLGQLQILIAEEFQKKQKLNPNLSIRGIAKKIGMDPSYLAKILSQQKMLGLEAAKKLISYFKLEEVVGNIAYENYDNPFLHHNKKLPANFKNYNFDHECLLHSFSLPNLKGQLSAIRQKLNWSESHLNQILNDLIGYGLIKKDSKGYNLAINNWAVFSSHPDYTASVKKRQQILMNLAAQKFSEQHSSSDSKHFAMMFSFESKDFDKAFAILTKACYKIGTLSNQNKKKHDKVYAILGSFFPVVE